MDAFCWFAFANFSLYAFGVKDPSCLPCPRRHSVPLCRNLPVAHDDTHLLDCADTQRLVRDFGADVCLLLRDVSADAHLLARNTCAESSSAMGAPTHVCSCVYTDAHFLIHNACTHNCPSSGCANACSSTPGGARDAHLLVRDACADCSSRRVSARLQRVCHREFTDPYRVRRRASARPRRVSASCTTCSNAHLLVSDVCVLVPDRRVCARPRRVCRDMQLIVRDAHLLGLN